MLKLDLKHPSLISELEKQIQIPVVKSTGSSFSIVCAVFGLLVLCLKMLLFSSTKHTGHQRQRATSCHSTIKMYISS